MLLLVPRLYSLDMDGYGLCVGMKVPKTWQQVRRLELKNFYGYIGIVVLGRMYVRLDAEEGNFYIIIILGVLGKSVYNTYVVEKEVKLET